MANNLSKYKVSKKLNLDYVSATRAKDYLIWARMPKKKKTRAKTFNWE